MSVELKVPSMVCDGCVDTVTKAIKGIDSNAKVEVDLSTKTVKVDGNPSEDSIKEAISSVGHTVEG
ncbi:heavy-metal-associated domain-containing protein [Capilliphycus salinus ALCB114379]|uniref:heavy-metal-associated domain-containing protein n=1 Tax=Capilliphycus salinus TaxID=2768948 RepID=UPI0039A444F9